MTQLTRYAGALMATLLCLAAACTGDIDATGPSDDTTDGDSPVTTPTPTVPPGTNKPDTRTSDINIPAAHPRLWFNAERLARAKAYFAKHPFAAPSSVADGDQATNAALRGLLVGDAASCKKAIDWAKSYEFNTSGVASDDARWSGEGIILTYDWCFSVMAPADEKLLRDRWNGYIQTLNAKPWGGIGMEGNNYYTGYFRNTMMWAIASWTENQPVAGNLLKYALDTRWKTSFLPYINAGAHGGAPGEGSTYGRRTFGYLTVPFTTLGILNHDMWNQSTYFLETVFWSIYSTTPGPSTAQGTSSKLYETFPYNEDERWLSRDPANNTAQTTIASYMAPLIEQWKDQPVAGYAKKYLELTGAKIESKFVEVVNADSVAAVTARDLSTLPLDYYASGLGMMYQKTAWKADATMVNQQFFPPVKVGHQHRDAGSFQIWRGGEFLSRETVGYAQNVAGYGGDGAVDCESPVAHNTLLVGGKGTVGQFAKIPTVLRMSSTADASYAAVDLTGIYDVSAEWKDREAEVGNPAAGRVVRETLFIRPLETLVVYDRVEGADASTVKTFLVHFPSNPTVSGNVMTGVAGNQKLTVTTAVPADASRRVIDESAGGANPIGQYRAEIETSGAAVSNFLHVLTASGAADPDVTVAVTEDASSYKLTLTHPSKGTAIVTFTKGIASTGGSYGFAASGTPTPAPLRANAQTMSVTAAGPVWAN